LGELVTDKQISVEEAVALIPDGAALGVGGVLLKRKPIALLSVLAATRRKRLRLFSFLSSLDAEMLAGHSCLAEVHAGYVGFEHLGFAPAYQASVADGDIRFVEYTEFLFVAGLRASLAGLPFMPAKGGTASQVLEELGFVEIADPYGRETVIAVPALRPDVTVLHAEAADSRGNVLGPAQPDFLSDSDAVLARASRCVVVTCEQLLTDAELRADPRPTLLYSYEVDAVVPIRDGARPTAMPGIYDTDIAGIRAYLAAAATDPEHATEILEQLR
jgi:glutaconate CoA-transferase subunit A